jgi:hypothetical protein
MLDVESGAVRAFTVTWPDSAMTWRRDAGGGWFTVVDGDTVRGYKPVLDEMVRRIRAISADEFVPESEVVVVRPFDAPPRSITVRKDDGAGHTVRIGRRLDGRVYAGAVPYDGAPERVVLTDTTVLDLFHQSVFDLRDRRVLSFDPDALGRLEFESPDFGVTLVRPGTEWTFPNPAAEPPAQQAVRRVLDALDALEYGRILENTPAVGSYDLSNASIRITIYDRDGRLVDRVLCAGAGSESGPYKVTSRHSGVIAELPREDVETLIFGFKQLRQP